jgi:hypothetical protein
VRLGALRGGTREVWFVNLETTHENGTTMLSISHTDVIGLGLPLTSRTGRLRISMTEGSFSSNEEVPALISGRDFKKMVCGQGATYIGSDGQSVAGCSLIVRAAEDGSTPGGRVRGVITKSSYLRIGAALKVESTSSGIVTAEEGYEYHEWNGELSGLNVYFAGKMPSKEQTDGIAARGGNCFHYEPSMSNPMSLLVVKGTQWRWTLKGMNALNLDKKIPVATFEELDEVLRAE